MEGAESQGESLWEAGQEACCPLRTLTPWALHTHGWAG